ncbi:MAG TPA: diaminopropionate ammonia-lyase, partial [Herpetosiphonaceae bacterium]
GRLLPAPGADPADLLREGAGGRLAGLTVISATDGNHGRALAAAAQTVGCRCVIVLHAKVSAERERAIAAYGAEIRRVGAAYDESVGAAAELAAANGWHVVSDTSYAGYEEIPRDVMQGYGAIAAEALEQTASQADAPAFSHVLLQGGVGGLAAGVASYLWEFHGARRPRLIVVEPHQADCLAQSALAGEAARTAGDGDSLMAGLACGAASPLAWRFLQGCVDDCLAISDGAAISAMRLLAAGVDADPPIVAGESGAAGFAGLIALAEEPALAAATGLDSQSRVLLINTEGATDPAAYRELVGASPAAVTERQAAWLAANR